jgi:ABC-type multidrug transport system fused ATPase/permease subunit
MPAEREGKSPVGRSVTPNPPSTRVLLWRALRLLVAASPGAALLILVVAVLQGVGPNVMTLAAARVVGMAPRLADSASARTEAIGALGVLAVALVVERIAASLQPVTRAYLGYRFAVLLDRRRMDSCIRLPGLEHFESPALADRLEAVRWSKSGPSVLLERCITMVRRIAMLAGSLLILLRLDWWIPLLICVSTVAVAVNDWRHAGRRANLQRAETPRLRYADYHRQVAVDPEHAREVRLFGLGDWLARRQHRFWKEGMSGVFADLRGQLRENTALNALRGVTLVVPLAVALIGLRDGSVSVETFTAAIFALRTASNGMYVLEGIPGGLRESVAFLPEATAIDELPEVDPRMATSGRRTVPQRLADGIRCEGVVFHYPGESRLVLNGLDLHLPAGESLALVGANGAGKSTLVKLLCRFYDPVAGRITLDGADIREFDLTELRRRMAVIFQDFVKLPVPARDNLAVATRVPADPDLLRRAAAQAGADSVLADLPDGWETVLSREFGGVDISGGQWQRLALARLLVAKQTRDAPILVFDEPTAALDVRLEADLYERFEELTRGATILLISHRFSTVRMASRVAVLEEGRVIELGTHNQLMGANGRYAELFNLQACRFQPQGGVR